MKRIIALCIGILFCAGMVYFHSFSAEEETEEVKEAKQEIKVIHWKELIKFVPEAPEGWTRTKPSGATTKFDEFANTQVSATYSKDKSKVHLTINDSGSINLIVGMEMLSAIEEDTSEGYKKGVTIGEDVKGLESYEYEEQQGELMLFFKKRLLITIKGEKIKDTKILLELANKIDFEELAKLVEANS